MGIGTNQFGRMPYDDVRAILQRMHQLGGAVIDTAAQYGESEVQIGKALTELNLTSKMFIATKLNAPGGLAMGSGGYPASSAQYSGCRRWTCYSSISSTAWKR